MTQQKSYEHMTLLYIEVTYKEMVIRMIIQVGVTIITIMLSIALFVKSTVMKYYIQAHVLTKTDQQGRISFR